MPPRRTAARRGRLRRQAEARAHRPPGLGRRTSRAPATSARRSSKRRPTTCREAPADRVHSLLRSRRPRSLGRLDVEPAARGRPPHRPVPPHPARRRRPPPGSTRTPSSSSRPITAATATTTTGKIKEDRLIPWIAWGPGVRPGHRITAPISTVDTAATALWALGYPNTPGAIGHPVMEAFDPATLPSVTGTSPPGGGHPL